MIGGGIGERELPRFQQAIQRQLGLYFDARPSAVVVDGELPGADGPTIIRRIRLDGALRQTPCLLLTASDDQAAELRAYDAGADAFVTKGDDPSLLLAHLSAVLRIRVDAPSHGATPSLSAPKRVLAVDDSPTFLETVSEALRGEGYEVISARSGEEAMELQASAACAARELAETRASLSAELERKNRELEAFSYSVSHDLRRPLRAIVGFGAAAAEALPQDPHQASAYLGRVMDASQRMGELIDDLLELSRVGRAELRCAEQDVAALALGVVEDLRRAQPERAMEIVVDRPITAYADRRMLLIVLENLLGNAWKFSSRQPKARIEVGAVPGAAKPTFFIRDNGAGFDPAYAQRLFGPFQRLHSESDFPGTGIGLATVHRIVDRHRGRAWAESSPGQGATFFVELPGPSERLEGGTSR